MTPEELDTLYQKDPEVWAQALGLELVGYQVHTRITEGHYSKTLRTIPDGPVGSYAVPLYKKREV